MKLIIDIPEELYKKQFQNGWAGNIIIHDAIVNGTTLPDNATNGDMIKAMFGVKEIDMSNTYCVRFPEEEDYSHYFFKDWWNALYKTESEE